MKLPFSVLTKFHQTVQITSELRAAVTPHALAPRISNIGEIWNGYDNVDTNDQIQVDYPDGFKHLL